MSQGKESRKREMSGSRIDLVQWSVCPDRFEYGERKRWPSMHDGYSQLSMCKPGGERVAPIKNMSVGEISDCGLT